MVRTRLAVIGLVVTMAGRAHADPTSLAIDGKQLSEAMTVLVEHDAEPVGLIATEDIRALTLARGDLVIGINGRTATAAALAEGDPLLYLDVERGGARVVIRVEVRLDAREVVIPRAMYRTQVDRLGVLGRDLITGENRSFTQVVKDGQDSGVMVTHLWIGFGTLLAGDIIRSIDGTDIDTVAHAVEALAAAGGNRSVTIAIDRLGVRLVRTLRFDDALVASADAPDTDVDDAPLTRRSLEVDGVARALRQLSSTSE